MTMKLSLALVLGALAAAEGFSPTGGISLGLRQQAPSSMPTRRARGLSLVRMKWQELKDPESGAPYYYNDQTGVTQWDKPAEFGRPPPPPPPPKAPVDKRTAQMEKVLERQRIQDAEKANKGALALESNRVFLILALLFIGLPLGTLAALFLSGTIPNPFEVCVQGGTSC